MADLVTIGKFSDSAIQKAIDDVTSKLKSTESGAFVAYTDVTNVVSVAAVQRVGNHFSVVAAAVYTIPDKKLTAAAELVGKW